MERRGGKIAVPARVGRLGGENVFGHCRLHLDCHLHLDERVARQGGDANCGAHVAASLAEHLDEQIRRTVDHLGLNPEIPARRSRSLLR